MIIKDEIEQSCENDENLNSSLVKAEKDHVLILEKAIEKFNKLDKEKEEENELFEITIRANVSYFLDIISSLVTITVYKVFQKMSTNFFQQSMIISMAWCFPTSRLN